MAFFNLIDLPEGCIVNVLILTTPKDICRLASVSSSLYSVAQSDTIWEQFLPRDIIKESEGTEFFNSFASKKDLYLSLCDNPIFIDEDSKCFSLEKRSAKKCYMLAARNLHITSDRPQNWQWISLSISRFSEVANLVNSNFLEIFAKIKIDMLSADTSYGVYLIFTTISELAGFKFSYSIPTIVCKIRIKGIGDKCTRLDTDGVWKNVINYPNERGDGWLEVGLGQFFVQKKDPGDELEIGLKDLRHGVQKRGLIIEGIEIRPMNIN